MAKYFDPKAPRGRVVFGGVEFIDNVTDDLIPGPGTLELFKSAGIIELTQGTPPSNTDDEPEGAVPAEKPAKPAAKPAK